MTDRHSCSSPMMEKEASSTLLPSPAASSSPRRKRYLNRRNIIISVPLLVVVLFCVIFFPVTFGRHTKTTVDAFERQNPPTRNTKIGEVWKQKSNFADLDDFRIKYYSSGMNNSRILTGGLPTSAVGNATTSTTRKRFDNGVRKTRERRQVSSKPAASRSSSPATNKAAAAATKATTSSGSVLSILYPANSYTPSVNPVGGTQFYALTPYDLTLASSVTLSYSVYIPANWDFVQGGKMPGLYGGTEGCGGGNKAEDCWSSRMAWRTNGTGELYAYLPQDKQNTTAMLEVKPKSYVNSDYGISLGRGSFNYTEGGWTNISQTVTLQGKNKRNGVFDVKINGKQAIYFDQVFYPTGIKGILFSTFFGGATPDWATPVDQYSFFRAFSIRINALTK